MSGSRIDELAEEIEDLQELLNDTVDEHSEEIQDKDDEIASLQSDLDTLTLEHTALQRTYDRVFEDQVQPLNNKIEQKQEEIE